MIKQIALSLLKVSLLPLFALICRTNFIDKKAILCAIMIVRSFFQKKNVDVLFQKILVIVSFISNGWLLVMTYIVWGKNGIYISNFSQFSFKIMKFFLKLKEVCVTKYGWIRLYWWRRIGGANPYFLRCSFHYSLEYQIVWVTEHLASLNLLFFSVRQLRWPTTLVIICKTMSTLDLSAHLRRLRLRFDGKKKTRRLVILWC